MNYSTTTEAELAFVADLGLTTTAARIAPQLSCREADAVIGMFWQIGAIATAQIWAARHADADEWGKKHHCQRLHSEGGEMVWFYTPHLTADPSVMGDVLDALAPRL